MKTHLCPFQSLPIVRNTLMGLVGIAIAPLVTPLPAGASQQLSTSVQPFSPDVSTVIEVADLGLSIDFVEAVVDTPDGVTDVLDWVNSEQQTQNQAKVSSLAIETTRSSVDTPKSLPQAVTQVAQNEELQVLHRDENPMGCQMIGDDGDGPSCYSFQLSQVGEILIFTYYFDNAPISLIALAEPLQQSENTAGYATGELRIANEPIEDFGFCVVVDAQGGADWGQYALVQCNAEMGLEFIYRRL